MEKKESEREMEKKVRREEGALVHSFSPTTHICGSLFLLEQNFCALQLLLTAYEKQIGSHFHQLLSLFLSVFFSPLSEKEKVNEQGREEMTMIVLGSRDEKRGRKRRGGESWCLVENEVTR